MKEEFEGSILAHMTPSRIYRYTVVPNLGKVMLPFT